MRAVSAQFIQANSVLLAFQALLVAFTGAGVPRWVTRAASRGWALILPLSIAFVVAGIALVPELAHGLTWIALVLVPPGAALAQPETRDHDAGADSQPHAPGRRVGFRQSKIRT